MPKRQKDIVVIFHRRRQSISSKVAYLVFMAVAAIAGFFLLVAHA